MKWISGQLPIGILLKVITPVEPAIICTQRKIRKYLFIASGSAGAQNKITQQQMIYHRKGEK